MKLDELELERVVRLLQAEVQSLSEHLIDLRRSSREEIDSLKLEIEALKRYISQSSAEDFQEQFDTIKDRCRYEIIPD